MKKVQVKDFFYMLMIASWALLGAGCGAGKKSDAKTDQDLAQKESGDLGDKSDTQKAESSKAQGPFSTPKSAPSDKDKNPVQAQGSQTAGQEASGSAVTAPGAHPLIGTYLQVENKQARIVIADGLILTTNLEFPSPAGNGTRLTPAFPHGLKYRMASDDYTSLGTYNDGTSVFRNIEIRVRLYNDYKFLDVTLIPYLDQTTNPGSGSGGSSGGGSSSSSYGTSGSLTNDANVTVTVSCYTSSSYGAAIGCPPPAPPLPPPPPPPSFPMPCPNPCPSDGNQLKYVYRFERT
jgi:hypothetical protein